METKNFIALGLILVVVVAAFYFGTREDETLLVENTSSKTCYIRNTEDGGSAELIVTTENGKVTGDFFWKPNARDSKTGPFEGVMQAGENNTKFLSATWNVYAEGKQQVEELSVRFEDGIATPGFGEMVLGSDGVYQYKDPATIVYEPNLSLADCETEIVSQPRDSQFEPQRRTLTGVYTCIPHRNTEGPQTLECALGIKADDGNYYALDFTLSSQMAPNFATGDRITVSGVFTPVERFSTNQWQKYNMIGVLSVTDSAKKI